MDSGFHPSVFMTASGSASAGSPGAEAERTALPWRGTLKLIGLWLVLMLVCAQVGLAFAQPGFGSEATGRSCDRDVRAIPSVRKLERSYSPLWKHCTAAPKKRPLA